MASTVVSDLKADSAHITEGYMGNLIVNGAARFANPIYADINGAQDINAATATSSLSNSDYVFVSSGGRVKRISYADLVADLSTKVSVSFPDSEGVGY